MDPSLYKLGLILLCACEYFSREVYSTVATHTCSLITHSSSILRLCVRIQDECTHMNTQSTYTYPICQTKTELSECSEKLKTWWLFKQVF